MAKMEHARWIAERLLAGWTYAPGKRDFVNRTSPYIVPWEDLPEDVRDFDRQAVRKIPQLLAELGEKVYRCE